MTEQRSNPAASGSLHTVDHALDGRLIELEQRIADVKRDLGVALASLEAAQHRDLQLVAWIRYLGEHMLKMDERMQSGNERAQPSGAGAGGAAGGWRDLRGRWPQLVVGGLSGIIALAAALFLFEHGR